VFLSIHKAGQDYLEAILMLRIQGKVVRSVGIAEKMGVSKASVSFATKALLSDGYITMNGEKEIMLTKKGLALAHIIYERHQFLTGWLESLGVDHQTAERDACRIEHDLSVKSFSAIKRFVSTHSSSFPPRASAEEVEVNSCLSGAEP
jgi:Mn-dependent DtxR family transcriptional regulator